MYLSFENEHILIVLYENSHDRSGIFRIVLNSSVLKEETNSSILVDCQFITTCFIVIHCYIFALHNEVVIKQAVQWPHRLNSIGPRTDPMELHL